MADVEFSVENHVAHVRLNRPQGMNAITGGMDDLLYKAWTTINEDSDIWSVILSAEGEKAFCIGADVSEGPERKTRMALAGGLTGIGGPLVTLKKPMVAAVQGFCVGGGFELAMCADIIVAAENAQFGLPETRHGIIGECGVVHRAVRQLPYHIAMAMILTGERINAATAAQFGLANEVVPLEGLGAAAAEWAAKINKAAPLANQAAKAAVNGRLGYPLEVALMTRFEEIEQYAESEDVKERNAAGAEGRKPVWTGR
ncbi:MAG: enoyl-CoA hydratase/isomerase family protein [Novosphingobium sp.]|nr:enoyl-CoA hydratase/isomerase family protein [Novosphingobium sp.]MCP5388780.1 enoyl-CoA hydratase/isomerase family protein [Novosphingobium sp.]